MKPLFLLLPSLLLSQLGFGQTASIPVEHIQMASQHLESQKDLSGYFIIGSGDHVLYAQGFGFADRSGLIPFSEKTLYSIGSITKPLTATCILLLMERDKLKLEDPVTSYFTGVPDAKKGITIHQLLTHSAGFPGALGDDYDAITDARFQQLAWSSELLFAPGTGYAYSNVGYSLLGMIIEKVSGESYSAFLSKNIFQPAGMKTAGYTNPSADYAHIAHGYFKDGKDWGTARDKKWNGDEPYWHLKANGGILVSADDMHQWYRALRNNLILEPETQKLQLMPHVLEGEGASSYYGYGYVVTPEGEVVQHNGGNGIFKADFRWFPKSDFFFFSVTNDANVRLFRLNDELIDILYRGKLPDQPAWQPLPLDLFPTGADQSVAKQFVELLQSYSQAAGETFIQNYCSAGIVERNGKNRLLEIFDILSQDIGTHPVQQVLRDDHLLQLGLPASQPGTMLKINLTFKDSRIDRLRAELEGL